MNTDTLINNRYQIKEALGHGGFGITYLAIDKHTNKECVVKCLSINRVEEWKSVELFEREAKVLANLDHPRIPKFIEFFTVETESETKIYLVQEYINGKTLTIYLQVEKFLITSSESPLTPLNKGGIKGGMQKHIGKFQPAFIWINPN